MCYAQRFIHCCEGDVEQPDPAADPLAEAIADARKRGPAQPPYARAEWEGEYSAPDCLAVDLSSDV